MENSNRRVGCWAAFLILLTALAYIPAMRGGYIWDDDFYVTDNPALTSTDGLKSIWTTPGATPQYYPLVFTSLFVEHRLWGLNPLGYHIDNVILHIINALLLWLVLLRLGVPGAFLAGLLFALHPVHVESVAWISERKNVLSGLFYLTSLLAYHRFSVGFGDVPLENRERRWYALTLALFIAGLLSKTVTCTLPAAILLLTWWKRGTVKKSDVLLMLPFFILGLSGAFITATVEKHLVEAQGALWQFSFADRILIAGRALWFYAWKLTWPTALAFSYPQWKIDATNAAAYLYPLAFLAVCGVLWLRRERWGRGALVAVLFFAVTLSPALGFVNYYPMRYSLVADHFQYLASIGLIVLFAALLVLSNKKGFSIGVVLALVCAGLTWRQTHIYKDAETLWRDTIDKNPSSLLANNNLGVVLAKSGRFAEAIPYYQRAVEIDPTAVRALTGLGFLMMRTGNPQEALGYFDRALALAPDFELAQRFRGELLSTERSKSSRR